MVNKYIIAIKGNYHSQYNTEYEAQCMIAPMPKHATITMVDKNGVGIRITRVEPEPVIGSFDENGDTI